MIEIGYYAPPPARRSPLGMILAWLVIAGAMYVIIAQPAWLPRRRTANAPSIAETRSPQLLFKARYAIGTRKLMGAQAPQMPLLKDHPTGIDNLRAIMVVGELEGHEAAIKAIYTSLDWKYIDATGLRKDVVILGRIYADPSSISEDEKQYLLTRHGWFAQLAILHNAPKSDPQRIAIETSARNLVIFAMVFTITALGAAALGLALLIWAIIKRVQGTLPDRFTPPADDQPFLEAFAVYLGGSIVISLAINFLAPNRSILSSLWLSVLLPLALVYLRVRGVACPDIRHGLGFDTGRGVLREIFAGIIGYLAGLPILVIGIVLTFILSRFARGDIAHPIINQPVDTLVQAVALVLLASAMAPIVEEALFRGAFFAHLYARIGFILAMLISSLIFAAIHPQGWAAIPTLAAIGAWLCVLRRWRGSIIAPMVSHAINNGVSVTVFFVLMT